VLWKRNTSHAHFKVFPQTLRLKVLTVPNQTVNKHCVKPVLCAWKPLNTNPLYFQPACFVTLQPTCTLRTSLRLCVVSEQCPLKTPYMQTVTFKCNFRDSQCKRGLGNEKATTGCLHCQKTKTLNRQHGRPSLLKSLFSFRVRHLFDWIASSSCCCRYFKIFKSSTAFVSRLGRFWDPIHFSAMILWLIRISQVQI